MSLFIAFAYNLPTLAALNIDYRNLFYIPGSQEILIAQNTETDQVPQVDQAPQVEQAPQTEQAPQPEQAPQEQIIPSNNTETKTETPPVIQEEIAPTIPTPELPTQIPPPSIPAPENPPETMNINPVSNSIFIDHNKDLTKFSNTCSKEGTDFSFASSSFQVNLLPLSVSLLNTDNSAYLLLTGVAN